MVSPHTHTTEERSRLSPRQGQAPQQTAPGTTDEKAACERNITESGMGRQAIARLQHRTALSTELLTAAQRLRLLREKDQRAALTDRQKVQVALYVLVRPDADRNDAERRTAEALGASNRRGWQVAFRAVDTTGDLAPALRPQLARVHDAVSDQRIAGVVCASRVDISQDDSLYTDELNWLRSRGGFLALARNEAAL